MAVQYQFNSNRFTAPQSAAIPPAEKEVMFRYFLERHITLPVAEAPEVSILIPVFNQYQYTMACLQSLICACRGKTTYEVILADDGSTDETRRIAERVENLRIVHNTSEKHGFLPNVNFAAKSARGKYLFLLNNDTLLQGEGGLLDRMIGCFQPDTGAVGCRLLRADGSLYDCGRVILSQGALMNAAPPAGMMDQPTFESDLVEGSAMMVRMDDWRELGGFDPVFGRGYFEESDFCMKLKTRKNLCILTSLQTSIIHFGSRSFQNKEEKDSLFYGNARIFMTRWHDYLVGREAGLKETDAAKQAAELWQKLYAKKGNE